MRQNQSADEVANEFERNLDLGAKHNGLDLHYLLGSEVDRLVVAAYRLMRHDDALILAGMQRPCAELDQVRAILKRWRVRSEDDVCPAE